MESRNTCNARFQLNYRVNGGPLQNYGQWDVAYSGRPTDIDLSLTPLANENIELVLAVIAFNLTRTAATITGAIAAGV